MEQLPGPAAQQAREALTELARADSAEHEHGLHGWRERLRLGRHSAPGDAAPASSSATTAGAGNDRSSRISNVVMGEALLSETMGVVGLFLRDSAADEHTNVGLREQLGAMAQNHLFIALTLSLSGLYFVVTGIQFWVTDYMTTPVEEGGVGIDAALVVLSFSISSLTAPTAGVFFGGWYIDAHGGYKDQTGEAAAATLRRCTVFGALALAFAVPAAFLRSFWPIQIAMWFVLFWGGALLSPATGVCINAVSPELRAFCASEPKVAFWKQVCIRAT